MRISARQFAAFAAAVLSLAPAWADEGTLSVGGDGVGFKGEAGGVKVDVGGDDGNSVEVGGVKLTSGEDGESIEAGGVKVSSDGEGGNSVSIGQEGELNAHAGTGAKGDGWSVQADAEAGVKGGATLTVGTDKDGNVGLTAELGGSAHAEASAGAQGQLGDDQNNVHGSAEVKLSADAYAAIKSQFTVGEDGTVTAKAGAGIGASVSAEGTIKGGVTICGVPIDVVLTGGVSAGAEAAANAGAVFDAKKGTITVTLEASAVLGVGAKGNISVEIGVVQLAQLVGTKAGEAVEAIGEGLGKAADAVGDAATDLWNWLDEKINGAPEDPFDSAPEGDSPANGGKKGWSGLKDFKLID